VCVNTKPKRKDISNNFREAIVAAKEFRKGYKAIFKLFESIILQRERLFVSGKHSRLLPIFRDLTTPPHTAYQHKHLIPTVKHGGGGMMI